MKINKYKHFFPVAFIILAPLILFAPVYAVGKALFWGTPLLQFIPWWSYAWSHLLDGYFPLWNSQLGMGAPLIANYQSAIFYPPHWINFLLYYLGDLPLMAWGQAPLAALHLVWAGLGMVIIVRRLGLSPLSQVVSGLAFGLSGYLVSRAGFFSINASVAWLPWIIACLTPAQGKPLLTPKRFLFLVFCLTMQLLAGHAQTTFYSLTLAGVWSVYWAWQTAQLEWESFLAIENHTKNIPLWRMLVRRVARTWGWLALAIIFAIGLAAVQLIPTAEYLSQSQRAAAVNYDYVVNYSFWPWHLVTLFAPDMFGSPVTGDYWGYANYWEDAIYIGLLPFLLTISAVFGSLRQKLIIPTPIERSNHTLSLALERRFTWFLLGIFLTALLLALGKNTPIFPWLYFHIPTFDMFQAPARIMVCAVFAIPLLAGIGAQHWRRPQGRGLYWSRLGTMGAFAVTVGAGLAWVVMGDISPSFIRATTLTGLFGVGSGLLTLIAPKRELQNDRIDAQAPMVTGWHWAVACFICLDLLVAGWGLNPGASLDVYRVSPTAVELPPLVAGKRIFISQHDEDEVKYERFLRFDTFQPGEDWTNLREMILPNENILDWVSSVNNFDPLVPGRYVQWTQFLAVVDNTYLQRLLNLMNVGILESVDPSQPYGVNFTLLGGSKRARWVGCSYSVPDQESAWELISSAKVDFEEEVLLESLFDSGNEICSSSHTGRVLWEEENPGRIIFQVDAPVEGWLVLSDTWYPGWYATVDGESVEILHANYLFKAVAVPAGEHEILFEYKPLSFRMGIVVSFSSCVLFLGLWVLYSRKNSELE